MIEPNKQNLEVAAEFYKWEKERTIVDLRDCPELAEYVLRLAAQACDGCNELAWARTLRIVVKGGFAPRPCENDIPMLADYYKQGYLAGALSTQVKIAELEAERGAACDGFDAAFPSQTQGLAIDNPVRAHLTQLREARREGYLAGALKAQERIAELEARVKLLEEWNRCEICSAELIDGGEGVGVYCEQCNLRDKLRNGDEDRKIIAELEARCASLLQFAPDNVKCGELQVLAKKYAELEAELIKNSDLFIEVVRQREAAQTRIAELEAERDRFKKVAGEHFDCYQDAITTQERYRKERDAAVKALDDANYRLGYTQAFLTTALDEVKRLDSLIHVPASLFSLKYTARDNRPTAVIAMLAEHKKSAETCVESLPTALKGIMP